MLLGDKLRSCSFVAFTFLLLIFTSNGLFAQEQKTLSNSIGMKFVLIPNGTFIMGSPPTEEGSSDIEKQHQVTISKDFYLGVHEVTQAQFEKVMGENPSYFGPERMGKRIPAKKGPSGRLIEKERIVPADTSLLPVENISWKQAEDFCKRLSSLPDEVAAGRIYRLPTEAEWEYACRAGTKTAYSFGENKKRLGDYAWYGRNASEKRSTQPVGTRKANPWGLHDMHGNVWEWCQDISSLYPDGPIKDPTGGAMEGLADANLSRILRGGCYGTHEHLLRSAQRWEAAQLDTGGPEAYGIRVVLVLPSQK